MVENLCPVCNEFEVDSERKNIKICDRCTKIFDMIITISPDENERLFTCQMFRLKAVTNNNWRMAEFMQNISRIFFLDEELEIIKKKELEKGKLL